MYTDSHAHLTCDPVYEKLPEILERAAAAKVTRMINICTDKVTLERGLELAEKEKRIYNVGATTPHDVEKEGGLYFQLFEEAARAGKLVAIGETGLDYHYEHSPKELQKTFLIRYFELALECNLPVVIHCRDAFDDLFTIADTHYVSQGKHPPLLLHCFTGTMEEAQKALERGWFISFSGIITFKRCDELRQVAKEVPLSQLLIETDTPYLAPLSQRGKPNEPSFLPETAQMIADLKEVSVQQVAEVTSATTTNFFRLS